MAKYSLISESSEVAPLARCPQCPAFQRALLIQETAGTEPGLLEVLQHSGYRVEVAASARKAFDEIGERDWEFVLWDSQRPCPEDLAALREARQRCPELPVLVMTEGDRAETAIELIKAGASDVLSKPVGPAHLQKAMNGALRARQLLCEAVLIPCAVEPGCAARRLVGRSPAMHEVYKQIGLVAEREEPVLIRGETGTGKELIARAIHHHSRRRDHLFLAVNCAAIPEHLLESELFGHEKGSFTGAFQRRLGAFEQSHGGTLFLDEIGDMPPALQAKILRVLQQREIQRLGGHETVAVDVRILAATNKVLESALQAGAFREDLYYRLQVVSIPVPPLREHPEDIPELAEHFIGKYTPPGEPLPALEAAALTKLQTYSWPGNVREMENAIRRALVHAKGRIIMDRDLHLGEPPVASPHGEVTSCAGSRPGTPPAEESPEEQLEQALRRWLAQQAQRAPDETALPIPGQMESKLLQAALRQTRGNQVRAARLLGISRATLRNWLKRYDLPTDPDRW